METTTRDLRIMLVIHERCNSDDEPSRYTYLNSNLLLGAVIVGSVFPFLLLNLQCLVRVMVPSQPRS